MRPIAKGSEPASLRDWKKRKPPAKGSPWDSLAGEEGGQVKSSIKDALLADQGFVCCYCEQRIDSTNSHIEHLDARHTTPQRALDYSNLLACCQKPAQCGALKGSRSLKVHPLLPDCREYFSFTGAGNILPTEAPGRRSMAEEAIKVLGLGINALNAQRRSALIGFTQALNGMNAEQVRTALSQVDARDSQGRNKPFASSILSVLKRRPPSPAASDIAPKR